MDTRNLKAMATIGLGLRRARLSKLVADWKSNEEIARVVCNPTSAQRARLFAAQFAESLALLPVEVRS